MNKINIPPIIIKNKIYEYQKLKFIKPDIKEINIVCINKIIPEDNGWFININNIEHNIMQGKRIKISDISLI